MTGTTQTNDNETGTGVATPAANGAGPNGGDTTAVGTAEPDVATLIAERDDYLAQLQRSRADFANFRRRIEQERMQAREIATRGLLGQLVPVLDDLHRALAAVPADQRETAWVQGVQLIERKLAAMLEREGVTPIEALGQPFDPALHEAVATEPGTAGTTVVEVYQSGYWHGQNLLRPAMVKVGDQPTATTD